MRRFFRPRGELILLIPLTVSGLAFAWFAFQPDPPDPYLLAIADSKAINESEQAAIAAYRAITTEIRAGALDDLAAADRVERDVLPAWRKARRRIVTARAGPAAAFFPAELEEIFRLREESWVALVAGVRNDDASAIERHRTKWQEADAIIARLRAAREAEAKKPR
ncbi:MAG: hypothetical protein H0T47_24090 [Planctomycetaceae bacterium]|nr:hypothetical protein [Planctomycetaceae bacterium]